MDISKRNTVCDRQKRRLDKAETLVELAEIEKKTRKCSQVRVCPSVLDSLEIPNFINSMPDIGEVDPVETSRSSPEIESETDEIKCFESDVEQEFESTDSENDYSGVVPGVENVDSDNGSLISKLPDKIKSWALSTKIRGNSLNLLLAALIECGLDVPKD